MLNKAIVISIGCFLSVGWPSCRPVQSNPDLTVASPLSHSKISDNYERAFHYADSILSQLNLDDKLKLCQGKDAFFLEGIPEHQIPTLYFSDASQGIHIRSDKKVARHIKPLEQSTAMPATMMLAATFNRALADQYAQAIGEECQAAGIDVLLGPGVNLYRQAQCGRNFEYLGEDPFLSSQMTYAYVQGLQRTGTGACLKHFCCNNTEFLRRKSNSMVDERTLHEIYLPAFQAGIDAGAVAVMTAYNQLNGEWCGESASLLKGILRQSLGFQGMILSDWVSVYQMKKVVSSGLNLRMPGNEPMDTSLEELLAQHKISEADIDSMIRPTLATIYRLGLHPRPRYDESWLNQFPAHQRLASRVAAEGIVLLKNEHHILPLPKEKPLQILLTGDYICRQAHGGGSGFVKGGPTSNLLEEMQLRLGNQVHYVATPSASQLRAADRVIVSIGTLDRESVDRPFELSSSLNQKIRLITSFNPNTIVIVNSGSGIQMSEWNQEVAALLYAWYGGEKGAEALAQVLCGEVCPSGKLPITLEKQFDDSPGAHYLPEQKKLNQFSRLTRRSIPHYDVSYQERIFVGYRWYERAQITPLYPFGFGLSYTHFSFSPIQLSSSRLSLQDTLQVTLDVTNKGSYEGAEVVQLYVGEMHPTVSRPGKELKDFQKIWLKPGQTKQVKFQVRVRDFAFWDVSKKDWSVNPGAYQIYLGTSSRDIFSTSLINCHL